MREGQWLVSPVEEREASSLSRRLRWEGNLAVWAAGFSACGAMAAALVFLDLLSNEGSWIGVSIAALLAGVLAPLTFWIAARDHRLKLRAQTADRACREEFGSSEGWIVDLMILQGDAPTGADRGILWIEDGHLCFSGGRTSFALSTDLLAGPCRSVGPIAGLRHSTLVPLTCRALPGRVGLSLRRWDGEAEPLRQAIDRWAASSASCEGQLPPTLVGPGAPTPRRLFVHAALATGYWLLTAYLLLLAARESPALMVAFAVPLLALAAGLRCGYPVTRWRALRDRRRLRRLG